MSEQIAANAALHRTSGKRTASSTLNRPGNFLAKRVFRCRRMATVFLPDFPTDRISITYNTNENNRSVAEFVQSQWKQNLGITVPLKTMEFKTFLPYFKSLQYEGFAIFLWSGDYMDPYTFLSLQYGKDNEGGTGFYDPKYDKMLDDANAELDRTKGSKSLPGPRRI